MPPRKKRVLQEKDDLSGLPTEEVVSSLSVSIRGRLEPQEDLPLLEPPEREVAAVEEALERKLNRRTYNVNVATNRRETFVVSMFPVMEKESSNETESDGDKKPRGRKKMLKTIAITQDDQDLEAASDPKKRGRKKETAVEEPMPAVEVISPAAESVLPNGLEDNSADVALDLEEEKVPLPGNKTPVVEDTKPDDEEKTDMENELVPPKKRGRGRPKKIGALTSKQALNKVDGENAPKRKRGRPKKE